MSLKPRLLIVNGQPASGKSRLAPLLCARLRLPLIGKDTIKEAMGDAMWARSVEDSVILGRASYPVLYALARAQLALDVSVAVEAPFFAPASDLDLRSLTDRSEAAMVLCEAGPEIIRTRILARAAEWHPVHRDPDRLAADGSDFLPTPRPLPDVDIPMLRVDTGDGYDPPLDQIVLWVRAMLTLPESDSMMSADRRGPRSAHIGRC